MPFAFENRAGKLVGFDVEMAYNLAHDMKVALEFVPIEPQKCRCHSEQRRRRRNHVGCRRSRSSALMK